MIDYKYLVADPLGDIHILQVSLPEGGNWNRESDRDDCRRAISYTDQTSAPRDRIAERMAF